MQYTDAVLSVTPPGLRYFFSIYRGLRALTRSYPRLVFLRPCRGLFSARLRLAKDSNLLIRFDFLEVPIIPLVLFLPPPIFIVDTDTMFLEKSAKFLLR